MTTIKQNPDTTGQSSTHNIFYETFVTVMQFMFSVIDLLVRSS